MEKEKREKVFIVVEFGFLEAGDVSGRSNFNIFWVDSV